MSDRIKGGYYVYAHVNNINGKRYIGITNNPKRRWYGNGKAYTNCPHFASAIKKYGWDNFTHYFIDSELSLADASALEKAYIKRYKTQDKEYGYNIADGGQNAPTMLGKHHSAETRLKMRNSALGRVISEEQRKNHSEKMKGKMIGKLNPKSKSVICLNTGEIFETQREAAETKGVSQSKISRCCQNKASHTHGLMWAYAETGDN